MGTPVVFRPRYCLEVLHHHFLAPGAWMGLDSHSASPTVQGKVPGPDFSSQGSLVITKSIKTQGQITPGWTKSV